MKILFCLRDRGGYNSGKFGLYNSAQLIINSIQSNDIECKLVEVIDGNSIDKEVYIYKPDLVVLEAIWVTPDKMEELVKLHPNVKWTIRVHSKATFLANEGVAFQWMNKYIKIPNVIVSTNNLEFNYDLRNTGYPSVYLPNIYFHEYDFPRVPNKFSQSMIDIGCFGALRPMKNQVNQALIAIQFANQIGKKLRFHINATSEEGENNVLKNLRGIFANNTNHTLVEHAWLAHKDFCRLVSEMDMGLQVSLSESFCIVASDFVFAGVPIVTSEEVKFVSRLFKAKNDTRKILNAMYIAYYGDIINLQFLNRMLLDSHNQESIKVWKNYVTTLQLLPKS